MHQTPLNQHLEGKKKNRPFGLVESPTFYPTEEEFKNPYDYIDFIAEKGRDYGIVKIVPPPSWKPKFSLDTGVSIYSL